MIANLDLNVLISILYQIHIQLIMLLVDADLVDSVLYDRQ